MKKNTALIIFLILFVLGCSTSTIAPPTMDVSVVQTSAVETVYSEALTLNALTKTATTIPTITPTNTLAISQTSPPLTSIEYNFDYEIVYKDHNFIVQQAFIGSKASFREIDIPIPKSRIETSSKESKEKTIENEQVEYPLPDEQGYKFGQIWYIPTSDNSYNVFSFNCEYLDCNGNVLLKKNFKEVWRGHMNGGVGFPIHYVTGLNGEIIFEYSDSNYWSNDTEQWKKNYVVYTSENQITFIESAYFPRLIDNQLIYFKEVDGLFYLYFNNVPIKNGYGYKYIINQTCCGGSTLHNIRNNGKMIDFFARIGNDWYHVQAGFQN